MEKIKIFHLLYIDDLKVYVKNEEELEYVIKIVEQFSSDINMTFGPDKCTILYILKGVYSTTNMLPEIPKLDNESNNRYQYLGIMEGMDFYMRKLNTTARRSIYPKCKRFFACTYQEMPW
eukprot:42718-Ditylum_brightwellii.AAC.1